MAFLTDRTLTTGVTVNDLIHIVITGDTSQNPVGSSYKATMGQVLNFINPTTITGGTYSAGTTTFTNNNGGTFNVTGFVTGDTFTTGYSYSNNTFTINQNNGQPNLTATISGVTGLTSTGTISSSVISATTYNNLSFNLTTAASDETTPITTGNTKTTFRMPCGVTLTTVRASLTTAQSSGSTFTVDINQNGSSILSTKLTIDNTEKTSTTAAIPSVISTSSLTDDAEITIDVDLVGSGTATGLKVTLIGIRV